MRNTLIVFSVLLLIMACKRTKYDACFSADKTVVSTGEIIVFTNCSDFDGGYTNCVWYFGDGTDRFTKGQAVNHSYASVGEYQVTLRIGEKENGAEEKMTIIVR